MAVLRNALNVVVVVVVVVVAAAAAAAAAWGPDDRQAPARFPTGKSFGDNYVVYDRYGQNSNICGGGREELPGHFGTAVGRETHLHSTR